MKPEILSAEVPAGRPREVVYDDLLRFQAELSFDLELPFFRLAPRWNESSNVLDFGSGNSYYAARLAQTFPEKIFHCVDKDVPLAQRARKWAARHSITVTSGSYDALPVDAQFDFLIARHTLSYMHDRRAFVQWLNMRMPETAGILVIDADDDAFVVWPRLAHLEAGNEEFKRQVTEGGGDRNVAARLSEELAEAGFNPAWTHRLAVHSDIGSRKYLFYMFLRAVAELDHGSPLAPHVWREIDGWALDPDSFVQIGLVATAFERG